MKAISSVLYLIKYWNRKKDKNIASLICYSEKGSDASVILYNRKNDSY